MGYTNEWCTLTGLNSVTETSVEDFGELVSQSDVVAGFIVGFNEATSDEVGTPRDHVGVQVVLVGKLDVDLDYDCSYVGNNVDDLDVQFFCVHCFVLSGVLPFKNCLMW